MPSAQGLALAALISLNFGAAIHASELLSWDITGAGAVTGSGIATPATLGVSGSVMTGGGSTGDTTSPTNTWNRSYPNQQTADAAIAEGNFFSFSPASTWSSPENPMR